MAIPPPPMQLMPTNVVLCLLLSFHVFLTPCPRCFARCFRRHGKRSTAMAVPRGKRHAHHVMHFLIACMPFRLHFIAHRLCFHRKADAAREGPRDQRRPPCIRAHPMPFCCFLEPNVQHVTLRCTGIDRWDSVGGLRPSFCHHKPPSRTPRTLRVAMRMVAKRPAMVHRAVRVVLRNNA